ncbi:potassium voltage-gated channel subfamily KQT member 2-like [Sarcoptes scabiei]|nr:potassium voltage-gated channel subfamily KQT member 2-like [Sarcoptes scabiei]
MLPFKTIREQCDDDVVDDHLDSEEGKIVNLRHQDVLNNYMIPFILNQDQFRGKLLDLCQIKDVIEFENAFPKRYDSDRFDFVGSGSYAKVLRYRQTIMSNREQDRFGQKPLKSQLNKRTEIKYSIIKLINVHSERFAKNLARRNSNSISNYRNVYNEFRISQTLSELNDGVHLNQYRYQCGLFPIVNNCHLVKNGPSVDENFARIEHRTFDENDSFEKRSDNSMLSISSIEQYLCVKSEIAAIDMEDCGQSLDCLLSDSFEPLKILSSVKQIIIGLMIAEEIFEFEHRDLHFGNILWRQISDDYLNFIYQNQSYRIPSSNVHIKVIDTTFSRMKIS